MRQSQWCVGVYPKFLGTYVKEGVQIREIGCKNCEHTQCFCSKEKLFGKKIPDCTIIGPEVTRVVVWNLVTDKPTEGIRSLFPSGEIFTGELERLHFRRPIPEGISVACFCGMVSLNKADFLTEKNFYLKGGRNHRLIHAGVCENSKILFLISSQLGTMPSLFTLSQLALVKAVHSKEKIRALAKEGYMPHSCLEGLPKITNIPWGFGHMTPKGQITLHFNTCNEQNHDKSLKMWTPLNGQSSVLY